MHEYSLVQDLFTQLDELQNQYEFSSIVSVRLSVGDFAGIDRDLLELAIEEFKDRNGMCTPTIEMEQVGILASCGTCDSSFHVEQWRFVCPKCQSTHVTIMRGDAIIIESVTMEKSSDER